MILNKLRNIIISILIFIKMCFLRNTCRNIFNICDQQNQVAFVSIDKQSNMIIKSGTYKELRTYFIFKILKQSQEFNKIEVHPLIICFQTQSAKPLVWRSSYLGDSAKVNQLTWSHTKRLPHARGRWKPQTDMYLCQHR